MRLWVMICASALLAGCVSTAAGTREGPAYTAGYKIARTLVFAGRYEGSERREAATTVIERLRAHGVEAVHSADLGLVGEATRSRSGKLAAARDNDFDNVLIIASGSEPSVMPIGPVAGMVYLLPTSRGAIVATLYDVERAEVLWSGSYLADNDAHWGFMKIKYDTADAIIRGMTEQGLLPKSP